MTFWCYDAIYPFRWLGFQHTIHPSAGQSLFLKHLEYAGLQTVSTWYRT